ncbi:hypothetical protein [Mastigocoleus testarum]|uniref:hypothetical protein n=1 Tax=Mastigocoleus testarum TaxID=996925 RepID=UPI0004096DD8|nr:hypothetical protein [Mastigocoleus testarum]
MPTAMVVMEGLATGGRRNMDGISNGCKKKHGYLLIFTIIAAIAISSVLIPIRC